MSKMADLAIDISNMLDRGESPAYIANVLEVPVSWVYEVLQNEQEFQKSNTEVFSPFETVNS